VDGRRWALRAAALGVFLALTFGLFALFQWGVPPGPTSGGRPTTSSIGTVETAGTVDLSRSQGGTRQRLTVRLDDGHEVVALSAQGRSFAPGDRVELWPIPAPFGTQYEATPAPE
jgi:hypothetical protein